VFWWRKRNEGFEWRDYVRTTILVRREQRRQRLKDAQAAAAAHVKDAGKRGLDAGLAGARSAGTGAWYGLRGLGSAARTGALVLGEWCVRAARALGVAIAIAAGGLWIGASAFGRRIGEPLGPILEPLLDWARAPRPNLALKIVAALSGLGAAYRAWAFGFDGDATVAAILCAVTASLVILAHVTDPYRSRRPSDRESLLTRLRGHEFELPGERRLSVGKVGLALAAGVAAITAGTALYHYGSPVSVAALTSAPVTTGALRDTADPSKLEGRAVAMTGDTLRVAGRNVLLDGIEAPETTQVCRRGSGTWPCGAAAKDALAGLVRGRRVTCDVLGEEANAKRARCYVGGKDVAEALVRNGNVFAAGGFWSSYAGVESQAEAEKVGLWAGEADRPQDYRDKRWEEAKKQAPEGCPIKGPIRSGARVYVLPWAPSYDSIRLRTSRGERWFCSESEAEAAGWTRGS
jgi:endonuclease YncB( thermonuclease family)